MEKRHGALISIDKSSLEARMRLYYDPSADWSALDALDTGLTENAARFPAREARSKVLAAESYNEHRLQRYALRPFDTRWCYYSPVRPLWNEPRPKIWAQRWDGNAFLLSRMNAANAVEGAPFYFTSLLSDDHLLAPDASCFPMRLRANPGAVGKARPGQVALVGMEQSHGAVTANLSPAARAYLTSLGITDPDADAETAGLLWMHALAVGYAPFYLQENADGIRQDWPRIPLPTTREALFASAALGKQLATLLDTEVPVPGVTTGSIRQELRYIGSLTRVGGGQLNPDAGDLVVTAGWGHASQNRVTMPGEGKYVERPYAPDERAAIETGTAALGLEATDVFGHLGETTVDVFLNGTAFWRNVPAGVWAYRIGGYQVMKKWLSYREGDALGRSLSVAEASEVRDMARRLAAIRLLEPALDANYLVVKQATYPWSAEPE